MGRAMSTRMMKNITGTLVLRTASPHLHHHSPLSSHFQTPSPFHRIFQQRSHLRAFTFTPLRFFSTTFSDDIRGEASDEGETTDGWEEEDEAEPKIGDGGDGGGVALHNVPWGQRALSIAEEVLKGFTEDVELYAFKTTPRGYVYVRLDKLTHEYGCPSIEELERYNQEYKKRLDEVGALGEIPDDLGLEVSSPGAERILKVPDDLNRFKDMPMRVCYTENADSNCTEEDGVYFLDSIEEESGTCVWKLADVKENRDPLRKGRPLTRKQKDWRLKLPFNMHKLVTLYLA